MGHGFSSPRPGGVPGTLWPSWVRGTWRPARSRRAQAVDRGRSATVSRSAGRREGDDERRDRRQAERREQHETERGDESDADLGRRDLEPFELGARAGRRRRRATSAPGGTPAWCAMATARAAGAHAGPTDAQASASVAPHRRAVATWRRSVDARPAQPGRRPPRGRPTWAGPSGRPGPAGRVLRRPGRRPASSPRRAWPLRRRHTAAAVRAGTARRAPSSRTSGRDRSGRGLTPRMPSGAVAAERASAVGAACDHRGGRAPQRPCQRRPPRRPATIARTPRARPGPTRSWSHRPPDHPGAPHPTRPDEDETEAHAQTVAIGDPR